MEDRTCVVCDSPFIRNKGRGTCSTKCYMWVRNHPGVKPDKRRACAMCDRDFTPANQAQRFCDTRCRSAASKRRNTSVEAGYVPAGQRLCRACGRAVPDSLRAGTKLCSAECGLRDRTH